ncbi:MAG: HNH endonuclease [Acidobacteria bacterium]|nr:HNH endonuclease [Acidobacteriota bacterium]MBI3489657.1 HNH endonuclease [Acidobacteriota bacterium]
MSRHTKKHCAQIVLALDCHYMPMVEISRRKALKAMATGRAHALDLKTWSKLGLQDVASQPFHAVVFSKARAVAESKLGFGRGNASILRRDEHRCQYVGCMRRATTVDHVIPRCQGGPSTWANLVACCRECNARKGGRTPEQAGMQLRSAVRSQRALLLERFHVLAGV